MGHARAADRLNEGFFEVTGYEFVSLGKMTDFIKKGMSPNEAWEKSKGTYGQFEGAAKYIDPRKE